MNSMRVRVGVVVAVWVALCVAPASGQNSLSTNCVADGNCPFEGTVTLQPARPWDSTGCVRMLLTNPSNVMAQDWRISYTLKSTTIVITGFYNGKLTQRGIVGNAGPAFSNRLIGAGQSIVTIPNTCYKAPGLSESIFANIKVTMYPTQCVNTNTCFPVCGDGVCTPSVENSTSCALDCAPPWTRLPPLNCPTLLQTYWANTFEWTATAMDNVTNTPLDVTCDPPSPLVMSSPGSQTVTCSATDIVGNTGTCSFPVKVIADTQKPSIICPQPITAITEPGKPGATITWSTYVTDNFTPTSALVTNTVCTPQASGTMFAKGVTPVSCTVTDLSGNSASCGFSVTVNDNEAPVVTCPASWTSLPDPGTHAKLYTWSVPVVDNVDLSLPPATCSLASPHGFVEGAKTTVTCTGADLSGNTAQCSFSGTVLDGTPPVITCPADIVRSLGVNDPDLLVSWGVGATDNLTPTPTVMCTPPSGTRFSTGSTTVTCTAADAAANSASCSFFVNVTDSIPPIVVCPPKLFSLVDPIPATTKSVGWQVKAWDVASGLNVAIDCSPPSPFTFTQGETIVACTGTDASGNSASCDFTVTLPTNNTCGDQFCEAEKNENCASCPTDCGACTLCNNHICEAKETCSSCPEDCGVCKDLGGPIEQTVFHIALSFAAPKPLNLGDQQTTMAGIQKELANAMGVAASQIRPATFDPLSGPTSYTVLFTLYPSDKLNAVDDSNPSTTLLLARLQLQLGNTNSAVFQGQYTRYLRPSQQLSQPMTSTVQYCKDDGVWTAPGQTCEIRPPSSSELLPPLAWYGIYAGAGLLGLLLLIVLVVMCRRRCKKAKPYGPEPRPKILDTSPSQENLIGGGKAQPHPNDKEIFAMWVKPEGNGFQLKAENEHTQAAAGKEGEGANATTGEDDDDADLPDFRLKESMSGLSARSGHSRHTSRSRRPDSNSPPLEILAANIDTLDEVIEVPPYYNSATAESAIKHVYRLRAANASKTPRPITEKLPRSASFGVMPPREEQPKSARSGRRSSRRASSGDNFLENDGSDSGPNSQRASRAADSRGPSRSRSNSRPNSARRTKSARRTPRASKYIV